MLQACSRTAIVLVKCYTSGFVNEHIVAGEEVANIWLGCLLFLLRQWSATSP